MSQWSSEQYLRFKNQRTQPAVDLAKKIIVEQPKNILDIGCGPGNSTSVLKKMFPQACILGVDNSVDMITKAKETYPNIAFQICDVTTELDKIDEYDIIFSTLMLKKGKINIDEISEYFPELLEGDIKELETEVMQLA